MRRGAVLGGAGALLVAAVAVAAAGSGSGRLKCGPWSRSNPSTKHILRAALSST